MSPAISFLSHRAEQQRERLDALLKNYKRAVKLVNAETMKGRL